MTNRIAIWLAAIIVVVLLLDRFVLGLGIPVAVGRQMFLLIEWLAFWR